MSSDKDVDNEKGLSVAVDKAFIYKLALAAVLQTALILAPLLVTYTTFKTSVELKLEAAEKERAGLQAGIKEMREDFKNIPFPFDEVARKTLEEHGRAIERIEFLRVQDEKQWRLQHDKWHRENR